MMEEEGQGLETHPHDVSGYIYASAQEKDNGCNGSVIGPLVSTFAANNNRLSIMPNGVRSPMSLASHITADGASGKLNGLLKKVQGLNDAARRNSMAHVDGATTGRASTARFSIAGGAAGRNSLKRPRYSLFPAGANSRLSVAPSATPQAPAAGPDTVASVCAAAAESIAEVTEAAEATAEDVASMTKKFNEEQVTAISATMKEPEMELKIAQQECEPDQGRRVRHRSGPSPAKSTPAKSVRSPAVATNSGATAAAASPLKPAGTVPSPAPVIVAPAPVAEAVPTPEEKEAEANKESYCHVTRLNATKINVTVMLSTYTNAHVAFHLQKQARGASSSSSTSSSKRNALSICNVEVELVNLFDDGDGNNANAQLVERENQLAYSYFSAVICNSRINGPLSERFLSAHLTTATDIPDALHAITGYVAKFRQLLDNLAAYTTGSGRQWAVVETENGSSANIILTNATVASNNSRTGLDQLQRVCIPLSVLLAKDYDIDASIRAL